MIYLKKPDGTIEQYDNKMMNALQIDRELAKQRDVDFGEIYTADSLPDEDKLALGLITQKDIDDKTKRNRIAEIKSELSHIDSQTIRPLRAKMAGTDTKSDIDKLSELEIQAGVLRKEMESLK